FGPSGALPDPEPTAWARSLRVFHRVQGHARRNRRGNRGRYRAQSTAPSSPVLLSRGEAKDLAGQRTTQDGRARPLHRQRPSVFQLTDVMLSVELEAELGDEIELGFEEIDVALLVRHERLEQVAGHVVPGRMTVGGGLLVEGARGVLGGEVAVEHLPDVLPD